MTVGVVLLNWNGADLTIACIDSLLQGSVVPDHIIVVDNASTDGSAEIIANQYNNIELIRNQENMGFAGGNNVGVAALSKYNVDYIWLLNNDTVVQMNCLEEFVDYMDSQTQIHACCGKIYYDEPRNKIWYAGGDIQPYRLKAKHRGALETDHGGYDITQPTSFITGCCMFMRTATWNTVGELDDRFFAYAEDLDWCLRARNLGYSFAYLPSAVIFHKISSSFRKASNNSGYTSPMMLKLCHRNRLYIIKKHSDSILQRIVCYLSFLTWCAYYLSALIMLRRWNKVSAFWAGLREGMIFKP